MAQLLYRLEGVRGRSLSVYDRKCVITTKANVGSFLTGNVTDGEKTIFYADVVGIQFKRSGGLIGYLQLETGSVQMNNQNSNMFSENTFTFENNKNGITNEIMESVYRQLCDMIEKTKYGSVTGDDHSEDSIVVTIPTPVSIPTPPPAPMPGVANTGASSFCTNCGKPLSADEVFCTGCGTRQQR